MIGMLNVTYPGASFKQVIQAFTSPDIPKRPESMKELSSVGYYDECGNHAVFMFYVPDAQVADFIALQSKQTASIPMLMPLCS